MKLLAATRSIVSRRESTRLVRLLIEYSSALILSRTCSSMKAVAESIGTVPDVTSSFEPHFQQNSRSSEFRVVQFWQWIITIASYFDGQYWSFYIFLASGPPSRSLRYTALRRPFHFWPVPPRLIP